MNKYIQRVRKRHPKLCKFTYKSKKPKDEIEMYPSIAPHHNATYISLSWSLSLLAPSLRKCEEKYVRWSLTFIELVLYK